MRNRLAAVAALSIAALAFFVQPALADATIDGAVAALKSGTPVYVDPSAQSDATLSSSQAAELTQRITSGGVPIFVAVIADDPGAPGGYKGLPADIGQAVGATGVYAVVSGHNFYAASSAGGLRQGQAAQLATAAFAANSPKVTHSIQPLLDNFVDRVIAAAKGGSTTTTTTTHVSKPKGKSHAGLIALIVVGSILVAIAAIFAGVGLARRRRRQQEEREEREQFQADLRVAQNKHDTLGTDVVKLQTDALLNKNAAPLYNDALDYFTQAENILKTAQTDGELQQATGLMANASARMSDVKSYLAGGDPVAERKEAARVAEVERKEREKRDREEARQRAAEAKVQAQRVARISPTNYAPAASQSTTNNNYFGGGYYNGMYYGPGYYQDPFWTWIVMDEMFDHDQRDYDRGDRGDYDQQTTTTTTTSSDSGWGGSGDFGSSSSSDSGGGWGGGGDFGGGGGDFGGGGGGDSGGGGW